MDLSRNRSINLLNYSISRDDTNCWSLDRKWSDMCWGSHRIDVTYVYKTIKILRELNRFLVNNSKCKETENCKKTKRLNMCLKFEMLKNLDLLLIPRPSHLGKYLNKVLWYFNRIFDMHRASARQQKQFLDSFNSFVIYSIIESNRFPRKKEIHILQISKA